MKNLFIYLLSFLFLSNFSHLHAQSAGQLHNQMVSEIISGTNSPGLNSETCIPDIFDFILQRYGIDLSPYANAPYEDPYSLVTYQRNRGLISAAMANAFNETTDVLKNNYSEGVAATTEAISLLEANAPDKFEGEELQIYLDHLSIARYSTIYWYPIDLGGEYQAATINTSNGGGAEPSSINWWKVGAVDAVGGVMGGMNPGTAAGASLISVIMMW